MSEISYGAYAGRVKVMAMTTGLTFIKLFLFSVLTSAFKSLASRSLPLSPILN